MLRTLFTLVVLVALAGCSGATLPYKPDRQPSGARVSAAYQLVGDRVRIEIATNGRRVEEATIVKSDESVVRPVAMDVTPGATYSSPVSIGVGGGTYGGRVGVGTGVSVGVPVGGSSTPDGNTFASFLAAQAGPPPWRLHVKLAGVEPVVIVVGDAPDARR